MSYWNITENKEYINLPTFLDTPHGRKTNLQPHHLEAAGFCLTPIVPFTVPEGMVIKPETRSIIYANGVATENYEVQTIAEHAAEVAAEAAANEAARIANKPLALKTAENAFIAKVLEVNSTLGIAIELTDGFMDIMTKINTSSADKADKLEAGLLLRTLWDEVVYHGGSFGDIQVHQI